MIKTFLSVLNVTGNVIRTLRMSRRNIIHRRLLVIVIHMTEWVVVNVN